MAPMPASSQSICANSTRVDMEESNQLSWSQAATLIQVHPALCWTCIGFVVGVWVGLRFFSCFASPGDVGLQKWKLAI